MQLKDFKQVSSQLLSRLAGLADRLASVRAAAIGHGPQGTSDEAGCETTPPNNLEAEVGEFFESLNVLLNHAESDIEAMEQSLDSREPTCAQVNTTADGPLRMSGRDIADFERLG